MITFRFVFYTTSISNFSFVHTLYDYLIHILHFSKTTRSVLMKIFHHSLTAPFMLPDYVIIFHEKMIVQ